VSSLDFLRSPLLLALVFAALFWPAGQHEARFGGANHGPLWACASAIVSAIVLLGLHGTWGWLLLAQIALLIGIGFFRAWRDS